MDYYARRKISFYGVQRAFAPVTFILREKDGVVTVMGCNDTPEELQVSARVGYLSFDGQTDRTKKMQICLPARSRGVVWEEALPEGDYQKGSYVVDGGETGPVGMLRKGNLRELQIPQAKVQVLELHKEENGILATVGSDVYAHGIHLEDASFCCSELYFDLLPGGRKTVMIYGATEESKIHFLAASIN